MNLEQNQYAHVIHHYIPQQFFDQAKVLVDSHRPEYVGIDEGPVCLAKILIVEDDEDWANIHRDIALDIDISPDDIHIASSVTQALELIHSNIYQLIITDGMEGRWSSIHDAVKDQSGLIFQVISGSAAAKLEAERRNLPYMDKVDYASKQIEKIYRSIHIKSEADKENEVIGSSFIVIIEDDDFFYNNLLEHIGDCSHIWLKTYDEAVNFLENQEQLPADKQIHINAFIVDGNLSKGEHGGYEGNSIISTIRDITAYDHVPVIGNSGGTILYGADYNTQKFSERIKNLPTWIQTGRPAPEKGDEV